mmetsp:Transcript_114891/g.336093  ORF Transcript_114891/g.336093 Transcript_114891/m.336093 type:complete len:122 (+) Transcript_114891:1712-2077(+)
MFNTVWEGELNFGITRLVEERDLVQNYLVHKYITTDAVRTGMNAYSWRAEHTRSKLNARCLPSLSFCSFHKCEKLFPLIGNMGRYCQTEMPRTSSIQIRDHHHGQSCLRSSAAPKPSFSVS